MPSVSLAYLDRLATELDGRGMDVRVLTPAGRAPSLHVVNPRAAALAENILATDGADGAWWFWWSWAERIAPVDDPRAAADRVVRVLATHGD